MQVKELGVRTLVPLNTEAVEIDRIERKWQIDSARGWVPAFVYEERQQAEGRELCLIGELHEIDGKKYLVKYDGEMLEWIEDPWIPREPGWFMLEISDVEAESLRLKDRQKKALNEEPELEWLMNLVKRAKRGSKTAVKELIALPKEHVEWFREMMRELDLSVDPYLVLTTPRALRRLRKQFKP